MVITTKLSLGDRAFVITDFAAYRIVRCQICANTGEITVQDEKFVCPKCEGKAKHREYVGRKWYVAHESAVGEIKAEASLDEPYSINYMINATGVGSVTLWKEPDCFTTRKDAESACACRNSGLNFEDEV